jgi:tetratricopeptide (TPR) repeat protein
MKSRLLSSRLAKRQCKRASGKYCAPLPLMDFSIAIVVFMFGSSFALAQREDPCKMAYSMVLAHKSIDDSIAAFRVCASTLPKEGFPHYDLGFLLEAKQDWSDAGREFAEALKLELNPELTKSANHEVEVAAKQVAATTLQERAALMHSEVATRVRSELEAGKARTALALARTLVADPYATWSDFALLGTTEMLCKQYDLATRDLLRARQSAPTSKQADLDKLLKEAAAEGQFRNLLQAAQLTLKQGDKERAGELFAAGWQLFPARADAGFAAVTCYLATPYSSRSFSILDALSQSPDPNERKRASNLRADLASIDKEVYAKRRQAEQVIVVALARYKSPEDLSDLSGKKLSAVDDDARRALSMAPSLVIAHELLAFCLMRERRYAAAVDQYRTVLTINPKAKVNFWLAWALWKNNQLAEARVAVKADMANSTRVDSSLRATLLDDLQLSKSER